MHKMAEKPQMAEIDTLFMTKTAENHTLWGCTYLYSPCKEVLLLLLPSPSPPEFYSAGHAYHHLKILDLAQFSVNTGYVYLIGIFVK